MIARVDRRALSHHTRTEYVTGARIATLPHQPEAPIEQQPVEMGCRGRSLDTCGLRWRNGLSVWLISVREQGERMRSRSQATGDWVQVQWIACLVSLGWTVSLNVLPSLGFFQITNSEIRYPARVWSARTAKTTDPASAIRLAPRSTRFGRHSKRRCCRREISREHRYR